MQVVSIAMRGPNLTSCQFWATRGTVGAVGDEDNHVRGFSFDRGLSGVLCTGTPNFILTAVAGAAADGLNILIQLLGQLFTFELTTDGVVAPGSIPILVLVGDTAAQVATKIETAIQPGVFGFIDGGVSSQVLPSAPTKVQIFATDNAYTGSAQSFSVLATAPMVVFPRAAAGVYAGQHAAYGLALLKTASRAFVFQGLTTAGDLPTVDGDDNPITYDPSMLSILAWPVRCGATGKRVWLQQVFTQSFTPTPEIG